MRIAVLEQNQRRQPQLVTHDGITRRNDGIETTLYKLLLEWFDEEELIAISFQMGMDYGKLPGNSTLSKVKAFVSRVGRQGRIGELVLMLQDERPNVEWPLLPDAADRERPKKRL